MLNEVVATFEPACGWITRYVHFSKLGPWCHQKRHHEKARIRFYPPKQVLTISWNNVKIYFPSIKKTKRKGLESQPRNSLMRLVLQGSLILGFLRSCRNIKWKRTVGFQIGYPVPCLSLKVQLNVFKRWSKVTYVHSWGKIHGLNLFFFVGAACTLCEARARVQNKNLEQVTNTLQS